MLLRAAVLYVLFVIASLAGGVAVWQSLEVRLRDERLADDAKEIASVRTKMQSAMDASLSAERRARIAEHDLQDFTESRGSDSKLVETLQIELAAARQQVSVAETAMKETEDRLAAEVSAHASLRAEAVDAAARAQRALDAANATAEKARQDLAKAQDAIQPTARLEPTQAVPIPPPGKAPAPASAASAKPAPTPVTPERSPSVTASTPAAGNATAELPWTTTTSKKASTKKPAAKRPIKDAAKPDQQASPLSPVY
jgi:hypothetical protein